MDRKLQNRILCSKWCDAGAVALATSPLVRVDRLVMESWQTIIMAFVTSLSCNRSISSRWMEMGSDMTNLTELEHRWESLMSVTNFTVQYWEVKHLQWSYRFLREWFTWKWEVCHHLLICTLSQTYRTTSLQLWKRCFLIMVSLTQRLVMVANPFEQNLDIGLIHSNDYQIFVNFVNWFIENIRTWHYH